MESERERARERETERQIDGERDEKTHLPQHFLCSPCNDRQSFSSKLFS